MTFTLELAIWLCSSAIGLLTAALSLRYSTMILGAVELARSESGAVLAGTRHLWRTEFERVIGWTLFLVAGLVSLFQTPTQPVVQTPVGTIILWLVLATNALWSFKTASDYLYSRGRWRAMRLSSRQA